MTNIERDKVIMDRVYEVAKESKDPSTKVGTVIASQDGKILLYGCNKFPKGVIELDDRYNNRDEKYMFIEHAERNAIFSAAASGVALTGCLLYVPWHPCHECARAIVQSGIVEVVMDSQYIVDDALKERWKVSHAYARIIFQEANVRIRHI